MSLTHTISLRKSIKISKFEKQVSNIDNIQFRYTGEDNLYFWFENKSTRGVDITFDKRTIDVRNTVLSNKYDYELTNRIVSEILSSTDGVIKNEEDELIEKLPLFSDSDIQEMETHDCKIIHLLSEENEISIFGPNRTVHFGKRTHEKFKHLDSNRIKDEMLSLILEVNYNIPNFDYGNIMQVTTGDGEKTMKLLTNTVDCIIDKYDYILLYKGDEQPPVIITNEILNTMLPVNWRLVDAYTVVAPITDEESWQQLLTKAEQYDLSDDFF